MTEDVTLAAQDVSQDGLGACTDMDPRQGAEDTVQPEPQETVWDAQHMAQDAKGWRFLAGSVQGADHVKRGIGRQDAFAVRRLDEADGREPLWLVAVADGAGSAPCSKAGATVAVEAALTRLQGALQDAGDTPGWDASSWGPVMEDVFEAAFEAVTRRAAAEAADGEEANPRLYASTLLVGVLGEEGLAFGHVGDGAAVALFDDGALRTVSPPHEKEYANEVVFLTSRLPARLPRVEAYRARVRALALFSDGIEHLVLCPPDHRPLEKYFGPLFRLFAEQSTEVSAGLLTQYLLSPDLRARTDDDLTLAILVRPDEGAQDAPDETVIDEPDAKGKRHTKARNARGATARHARVPRWIKLPGALLRPMASPRRRATNRRT